MIVMENYLGVIDVSESFVRKLVEMSVSECFGVNQVGLLEEDEKKASKKKREARLVAVKYTGDSLVINLHIEVPYGINIMEVVKSVKEKIRYNVKEMLNKKVSAIHIYIDSMRVS